MSEPVAVRTAGLSPVVILRRRRRGVPILVLVGGVFLVVVVICAAFGPLIVPHDPNAQDLAIGVTSPSADHWFGTDDLGRDVFARTVVGARTAIVGPIIIALGAMLLGNLLGLLAGYRGGAADATIMRWADLMYALPGLLVAIVVVGIVGGGYFVAVGLLVVLTAPFDARLVRGATLEQRALPYVEAARTLGLSPRRIMFRHIWPNVAPLVVVNTCLTFAFSLVTLAALSFLGMGAGPGTADWGRMLSEGRSLLFDNPVAALAPGFMLVLTAAAVSLIGDWAYERLSDRGRAR
jgi:peptide/nickel transport system permease protein